MQARLCRQKGLQLMRAAALLKYELHYSIEILFLEPLPAEIVNEQRSFSVCHSASLPLHSLMAVNNQHVWYMFWLLSLFWQRNLLEEDSDEEEDFFLWVAARLLSLCDAASLFCGDIIKPRQDASKWNRAAPIWDGYRFRYQSKNTYIGLDLKSLK